MITAQIPGGGCSRVSLEAARALDAEDCVEDVRLIKSMNMNAVRMSHYPPDVAFLEACDELGLYVIAELSGWQKAHGTEIGRKLDYSYKLDGAVTYHGITFDHPEDQFRSVRWLGEGPYRVWQNRLRGTMFGEHQIYRNDIQPEKTGPSSQPVKVSGVQTGSLVSRVGD